MINEESIEKETFCAEQAKYLRILDKVIVSLMLAILMVLTLPVLNSYHAPKSTATAPQMRSAPSNHSSPDNRLTIV